MHEGCSKSERKEATKVVCQIIWRPTKRVTKFYPLCCVWVLSKVSFCIHCPNTRWAPMKIWNRPLNVGHGNPWPWPWSALGFSPPPGSQRPMITALRSGNLISVNMGTWPKQCQEWGNPPRATNMVSSPHKVVPPNCKLVDYLTNCVYIYTYNHRKP